MAKIVAQSDWLAVTDPDRLLNAVHSPAPWFAHPDPATPATMRRLRLFGCACARMAWDALPTDARNAITISERFAGGQATRADVEAASVRLMLGPVTFQAHALCAAGWASCGFFVRHPDPARPFDDLWSPYESARSAAKALATRAAGPAPPGGNPVAKEWDATYNRALHAARAHQAELVRDIFPPPGYAPVIHPDWRTSTVVALARQTDETGDFSAVPILADALQDAGCDDDAMLDRCRAPSGVHCRGNWVVDLVLGGE